MLDVAPWEDEPRLPTTIEELDRKTVGELERVINGLKTGKIALKCGAASLQTLWEITAGLVPQETMDLLGRAATIASAKAKFAPDEAITMVGPSTTVSLTRNGATCSVVRYSHTNNERTEKHLTAPDEEIHREKWASDKFKALILQLNDKGLITI